MPEGLRIRAFLVPTLPFLAALCWACGGDGPVGVGLAIPRSFRILGEAQGVLPSGVSLDCFIDVQVQLVRRTANGEELVEWSGDHGGHVGRSILAADGAGVAFDALVGGDAVARLLPRDSVEIVFPANVGVENRFWRELAVLAGTLDGAGVAAGTWSCQPLDVESGGYVDTTGTAAGTWELEAL